MKRLLTCILLSITLYEIYAADNDVTNANDFIDEVLENLRSQPETMQKFDPLNIPDIKEHNQQVTHLSVSGLSKLYRNGDCTIEYHGDQVRLGGHLAVDELMAKGQYAAKAILVWMKGDIAGSVKDLAVELVVSGKDGKAQLDSFEVVHMGDYTIHKITGATVVYNWLLKIMANMVAKVSRIRIMDALENGIAGGIRDALEKVELPELKEQRK